MRLQVTQMSWSGESCELLIQIQGPSPDWRLGVKCQFTLQVQRKLGPGPYKGNEWRGTDHLMRRTSLAPLP